MKFIMRTLLVLFSFSVFANEMPQMGQGNMQEMMKSMRKMQACMAKVDQTKLQTITEDYRKFNADTKSLCHKGKRKEAQSKAMAYGKKMINEPTMKLLKSCGEMAMGMMPVTSNLFSMDENNMKHICDSLK